MTSLFGGTSCTKIEGHDLNFFINRDTLVRTLRCNKGRFISQLVELRDDGDDVDYFEILPV